MVHRPVEAQSAGAGSGSIKSNSSLCGGSAGSAKQYIGPQKIIDMSRGVVSSKSAGGNGSTGGEGVEKSDYGQADSKMPDLEQLVEYK